MLKHLTTSRRTRTLILVGLVAKTMVFAGVVYAEGWWPSSWWPGSAPTAASGATVLPKTAPTTSNAATLAPSSAALAPQSATASASPTQPALTREQVLQIQADDRVLGSPMAPVTIIEYASMTCSHCADFKQETLPLIKKNWIETGKANYILRDLPWDNMALGMAKVARCAPPAQFYPLAESFFSKQKQILTSNNPVDEIKAIAALAGISAAQTEACIKDEIIQKQIVEGKERARNILGVTGTPTFYINGTEIDGAVNYATINKALEQATAAKKAANGPTQP